MNYFQKLDFTLPEIDMTRILSDQVLEGYGEQFRSYDILDLDYFYSIYSKKIHFAIPPDIVNYTQIIDNGAVPHVDFIHTTINYYINSANCITAFWKPKNSHYEPEPMMQLQPDGSWQVSKILEYDQSKLQLIRMFRSRDRDAYIMSTKEIHSVIKPQRETVRKFFRFMWLETPMQEVLKNTKIISS